jgi:predicted N-acetyltransferase YhbS
MFASDPVGLFKVPQRARWFPRQLLNSQPEYFQTLSFDGELPAGVVKYHEAFKATE